MVTIYPRIILLWAGILAVCLFLALRYDPAKPSAKVMRQCALGLALLLLWNALPLPRLGVNPLSAWLTGALGLPGLAMLAVLGRLP